MISQQLSRLHGALTRTTGCYVANSIEARVFPNMGIGIAARERIGIDEVVFQAGPEAWLPFSAEYAIEQASQQAPAFLQHVDQVVKANQASGNYSSQLKNALVLSTHLLIGNLPRENELYELYMNSLPSMVDLPLYWEPWQINELQGCVEARRAIEQG